MSDWIDTFAAELVCLGWDEEGAQRHAEAEHASDPNRPVGLAVGEFLFQLSEDTE